ncbi:MAG: flagellar type III secretion system pore protein FliP [Chloroflexi bacterium]|nr:flagellar type III secretion system pore protein FliP [Chloroflexota bacterium]
MRGRTSRWRRLRTLGLGFALAALPLLLGGCAGARGDSGMPSVRVQVGGPDGGDSMSMGVQLLLLLTVLSLVPAILMMVTSFIRITIVLSFARSAIGMQQMPPNQILLGLALFLTVFIMAPIWSVINEQALQPYLNDGLSLDAAVTRGSEPLREFMFKQTRERDLGLFLALGKLPQPNTQEDVPTYALIPAFMISELKTAFQMGFLILLPFVVIDMVVSSALMSMGMMMLPPTTISLPFKVLLFVMADGWYLITRSLVTSFSGG